MKKIVGKWLPWLLALGIMAGIFFFSAQTGSASSELSGGTAFFLAKWIFPGFSTLSPEKQLQIAQNMQFAVRKTAHAMVYAALGASLYWAFYALKRCRRRSFLLAWATGTIYAFTDECHQLLVPGRSGQWQDVVLDSAGVLLGCFLCWILFRLIKKRLPKQPPENA